MNEEIQMASTQCPHQSAMSDGRLGMLMVFHYVRGGSGMPALERLNPWKGTALMGPCAGEIQFDVYFRGNFATCLRKFCTLIPFPSV